MAASWTDCTEPNSSTGGETKISHCLCGFLGRFQWRNATRSNPSFITTCSNDDQMKRGRHPAFGLLSKDLFVLNLLSADLIAIYIYIYILRELRLQIFQCNIIFYNISKRVSSAVRDPLLDDDDDASSELQCWSFGGMAGSSSWDLLAGTSLQSGDGQTLVFVFYWAVA